MQETMRTAANTDSDDTATRYRGRRALVLLLNAGTLAGLIGLMAHILGAGGWHPSEWAMLGAFAITLPWLSIGLWNAVIGFLILRLARHPAAYVTPAIARAGAEDPIACRTAITMTIRNEAPADSIARLQVLKEEIDVAGVGDRFDIHVLSDTSDPGIAAAEERAIADWRRTDAARPAPHGAVKAGIHYRRRRDNAGFKAGNVWEFVTRCGDAYDFFLPLDADSHMSARAVLRMVRIMQANPTLGLLQGLVVGMPARTLFARTFQFGMRHGMRSYTMGSAWWQGDCGPFWGHNAVIRIKPFRDHCALPRIPGRHALSGAILSHDQVEAALMRRAGYEVRVLAEEDESWEENPPTLPDFIKRDLRWCQGNMQYGWLLGLPGLKAMSRVQLLLAIFMYLGAPGWMLFLALGAGQLLRAEPDPIPETAGIALFVIVVTMSLMPKLMGVLDLLSDAAARVRYGGAGRVLAGALTEITFSALLAPVVSFAQARFMAGLVVGRKIGWAAQRRVGQALRAGEALRGLWPQMLFGAALAAALAYGAPGVLPWASPLLASFLLAVPFAVLSAHPTVSAAARRIGLCDIPEDRTAAAPLVALDARRMPAAA